MMGFDPACTHGLAFNPPGHLIVVLLELEPGQNPSTHLLKQGNAGETKARHPPDGLHDNRCVETSLGFHWLCFPLPLPNCWCPCLLETVEFEWPEAGGLSLT